jgi:hypothetical protein
MSTTQSTDTNITSTNINTDTSTNNYGSYNPSTDTPFPDASIDQKTESAYDTTTDEKTDDEIDKQNEIKDTPTPSITFSDITKMLVEPRDIEVPVDVYQYDLEPQIVSIATGENEKEYEPRYHERAQSVQNSETKNEDISVAESKPEKEAEEKDATDISNYDNEIGYIEPPKDIEYPTEKDTVDEPEKKDDTKLESDEQLYKRNPYVSTLVFFIPAFFMVLIVLGLRGVLTFPVLINCIGGGSIVWFILAMIINYSNTNGPTQGLFTPDGSVNGGASNASFFKTIDKVLKMFSDEGGLINVMYNFVHFFLDWFQDSLKILNIRKMYFLLTLSVVMMGFLYIMHKLFPLPFGMPSI